jgi:methyl coenzyme M reductase subunit D
MSASFDFCGWVCKQCRDDMLSLGYKVIFGDEGFVDDNLTIYDSMEIGQKVNEFNELFEDKGCSAEFLYDDDSHYRIEIIVDDGQPELAAAVKAAESIEKLCRHKVPFSRRRR